MGVDIAVESEIKKCVKVEVFCCVGFNERGFGAQGRGQWEGLQVEARDEGKVRAAALERPVEVRILARGCYGGDGAIGKDDLLSC